MISEAARGQLDDKLKVVGLHRRLVSRLVSFYFSAFRAAVNDNESLFGVGLDANRLHFALAFRGSVTRVDIKVKRPKAEGAMISGAVAKGLDLLLAVFANKGGVVFSKSFLFHNNL